MPVSNSALRRYTTPTCTLQIVASSSLGAQSPTPSLAKQLQFILDLDDPQLSEEKRVGIQGDREELEALHEAVTNYVQSLLNQSPEQFNRFFPASARSSPDAAVSSSPGSLDLNAEDSQASSQKLNLLDQTEAEANSHLKEITPKDTFTTPDGKIFLQPGFGLSHNLFLGSLATKETGAFIQLSMLQLFDLSTALNEYADDVVALPTESPPMRSSAPSAVWATIAAVLLGAVGLIAAVQFLNRSDGDQQTASRSTNNNQQPTALQPSPPTQGVPTPPISSTQPSPSLSPEDPFITSGGSNIPPGANLPPQPTPGLPGASPGTAPDQFAANPPVPPAIPPAPAPGLSNSTPSPDRLAPPANIPIITPSPNPDLEAALSGANRSSAGAGELKSKPNAFSQGSSAAKLPVPKTPTTSSQPQATASDSIAQVKEVRKYFQQRWKAPPGLTQTLQYSLLLDVDGSIQAIEPFGGESRNYVDSTPIPRIGEPFISASNSAQTPWIRVVLNPNGKVQAFLQDEQGSAGFPDAKKLGEPGRAAQSLSGELDNTRVSPAR